MNQSPIINLTWQCRDYGYTSHPDDWLDLGLEYFQFHWERRVKCPSCGDMYIWTGANGNESY